MNASNSLRHGALVLIGWLVLIGAAAAQPSAPVASDVVDGSYSISYSTSCQDFLEAGLYCTDVYLMEMIEPDGSWTYVAQDSGLASFSARPPGTYSYMVVAAVLHPWYGYYEFYSPVTTVIVASPEQPLPVRDDILSQLNYSYEVSYGDFDLDSRTDFFVRKTAGGAPLNGTLESVILRQDGVVDGSFSLVVPSADQEVMASTWTPAPAITTRLHDIDVDGFVDVTLINLASVVSGAADQIIYSPGQPGQAVPRGMRGVDSALTSFVGEAMDYLYDPDFFLKNATVYYYWVWAWYFWCPQVELGLPAEYFWQGFSYCYIDIYYYYSGYYYDYSAFNQDALALWTFEDEGDSGRMSKADAIQAIKATVESIIRSQIGGWPMEELLGQEGPQTDELVRRAMEAVQSILNMSRALPEHVDMANLPPQTPRKPDVIYVTGHELFMNRVGHLALEYASPQLVSGLYMPTTLSGQAQHWWPVPCFPWMTDLSFCGWGKLLAETNKTTDTWYSNFYVGELIPFAGTPGSYWNNSLVPRHNRYIEVPYELKPDYNALPDASTNSYNSNGYVRGLNGVGGYFLLPLDMNSVYPGWDRPVPDSFFQ
jgi:hypothetical protein